MLINYQLLYDNFSIKTFVIITVMSENRYSFFHMPGNDCCADCHRPEPQWAVMNLGILICEQCVGAHSSIGSKLKSIKLTLWDEEHIKYLKDHGNDLSKLIYEKNAPVCYRRPQPSDPQIIRDEWIRAKYERLEFTNDGSIVVKQPYITRWKEGYLWKKGKKAKNFLKRRFVLDVTGNTLKYYNKEGGDIPKASIKLDDLNVSFAEEKVGHTSALQLSFLNDTNTRNIFVYAESSKEAVHWYTAIRFAKLTRLSIAYPGSCEYELCSMLTRDFIKEGWLNKTGPRSSDSFRRRWVTLDGRSLLYYNEPLDAYAKGEILIGSKGFEVLPGFGTGACDSGYGFVLKTPSRIFQFSAETEEERSDWLKILNSVINK